ncbi:SAV_2336 N-terminal domain-related protein [Dactylosporangium sp. NPDC050688]|uniref:SAV_2336 N-terminal domain-related protein n=1 Tax=Dactylosporangium sp. NPDC050688 TaxID=3157217 RepID=UPI0033CB57B8
MPDRLRRLVEHLISTYDLDPVAAAEVLQLWQTPGFRTASGPQAADAQVPAAGAAARRTDTGPPTTSQTGRSPAALPVYGPAAGASGARPASVVFPYRVREPLDTLGLSRALRPLRRRWPGGRHTVLDVAATVRVYAASRVLVPHFRPGPERWFDLDIVVDASVTMAVWAHTVEEFVGMLAGLGVFRTVRIWRLGAGGQLLDPDGRPVAAHALNAPDGRRLVMVLSDCTAAWWRAAAPWLALRAWARNTPTVLINPLPTTVWRRTALDLPTVRLRAVQPGGHDRDLSARGGPPTWTPVPIPALTQHALGRWARAIMNTDPDGCDGALIPPDGRTPPPADEDDPEEWRPPTPVEALRIGASGRAVRLAVLCALQDHDDLDLSYLHLIRQELVPDADADDLAAIITGGVFDPVVTDETVLLRFRPGVRQQLRSLQTPTDAWDRYRAITRHMTTTDDPGARFAVLVADPAGTRTVPTGTAPIGEAEHSDLRRLGLPDAEPEPAPPEAPGPDMSDDPTVPLFYLSFAHAAGSGSNADVTRCFTDLSFNVSELARLGAGQDPGFYDMSLTVGDRWEQALLRPLGTCQMLVFLLSPRSLNSQWCAREWSAFARRRVYRRATGEPVGRISPIFPVIWAPIGGPLPHAVSEIQMFDPGGTRPEFNAQYRENGLLGLLRTGQRDAYDFVIWRLAMRIQQFQYDYWVEPSVPRDIAELRNTFDRPER